MPEVIKVSDTEDLVPTKKYKYATWPFENFNPVQSTVFQHFKGDSNIAIAAATSAGKTVCSEIYMAYEVRKRKGKAIYVGPLKALAKEKEEDWKSDEHHFNDLNVSICTGDYKLTQKRVQELDDADVIVMTPEMLASRCRNHESEKSHFLQNVGTIVFDESHLLTVPNRGDHIEVALMQMVDINPNVRIILLSATMPNVDEICGWLCELTGRDTYYLESDYRPCPLNIHYQIYYDAENSYDKVEAQKVGTALGIIEYYPDDKFLVFVHTKRTGKMMLEHLKRHKIEAEFHNANLGLADRMKLENKFKNDPNFKVIVSTSTLAWGLNLPARRVIVTGVHRGLTEVENYDIRQMVGRAGRPAYDPRGDAYVLIPERTAKETLQKLKREPKIESQLLSFVGTVDKPHYKVLAFHLVAEIYQGNITTKKGLQEWFSNSLAHYQDHDFDDGLIDTVMDQLTKCYAVKVENGEYSATNIGKVASIFYFSPFDVSDLRRNFKRLFEEGTEGDDHSVAMALANIDTWRWGITSRDERNQMGVFAAMIKRRFGEYAFTDSVIKTGYAYHNMLHGKYNVPAFAGLQGTLRVDCDRTIQVLKALDSFSGRWGKQDYLKLLQKRLNYGVSNNLLDLCSIPNIGKARAERLYRAGIKNKSDFVTADIGKLATTMKVSVAKAKQYLKEAQGDG